MCEIQTDRMTDFQTDRFTDRFCGINRQVPVAKDMLYRSVSERTTTVDARRHNLRPKSNMSIDLLCREHYTFSKYYHIGQANREEPCQTHDNPNVRLLKTAKEKNVSWATISVNLKASK